MPDSKRHLVNSALAMLATALAFNTAAQGTIRGTVLDRDNGEPIPFHLVYLHGTEFGAYTNEQGFYSFVDIPPGTYLLVSQSLDYDSLGIQVTVTNGEIITQQLLLHRAQNVLPDVHLTAERLRKENEIDISTFKIPIESIKRIPTIGGEADLAQYLSVLPGVISSGDQGGQLYIRGGAPIHSKVLLDGMDIYNAFHSIGLFSVYETEVIRSVDVLTGGFNAEYGGRISAVIDVDTRDGNKKEFAGNLSTNTFMSKLLIEGPISKLKDDGSSISYLLTAKTSYLKQSSPLVYRYVGENPEGSGQVLPYTFTDLLGKLSINSGSGSSVNFIGFNYHDKADFVNVATYGWNALGFGTDFTIVPSQSQAIINGNFVYSDYNMTFTEAGSTRPRFSGIAGFNLGMDFTYFPTDKSEVKYGVDINGFATRFEFFNSLGIQIDQNQNTTEIGGFVVYRHSGKILVLEPSFRVQYYASLNNFSPEPRFGLKLKATEKLRVKVAGGLYSQNLISSKSDQDVVNLFTGFLSGPEEQLERIDGTLSTHKLQKAIHLITGIEYDVNKYLEVGFEPYAKRFTQLININRNKIFKSDPNYEIETGNAYGLDFVANFDNQRWYLWATYSIGWVTRNNGEQTYPPHFDRRHNANLLASYVFGENNVWQLNARWNIGSGFPFTLTQGFFEEISFLDGVSTDYLSQNGSLGIIYDDQINAGRLPWYHRLDVSAKRTIELNSKSRMEVVVSIANVYNRKNVFYFDRIRYERVDQLPFLPALGASWYF